MLWRSLGSSVVRVLDLWLRCCRFKYGFGRTMWDCFHIFCSMCLPCLSEETLNWGLDSIVYRCRLVKTGQHEIKTWYLHKFHGGVLIICIGSLCHFEKFIYFDNNMLITMLYNVLPVSRFVKLYYHNLTYQLCVNFNYIYDIQNLRCLKVQKLQTWFNNYDFLIHA